MRLFLDQMIDRDVTIALQDLGIDVQCAVDVDMSKADDLEILNYCISVKRTLITLDEHFGDWTFLRLNKHPGVIRLKVHPTTTSNIKKLLLSFMLRNRTGKFKNFLIIVKSSGIRWIKTDN